ncbi:MAG: metallophosphoesterase [Lentisphaeria bacterium]|nr:metallophosphoesterase [Lentisphaeria bacterium]
MKKIFVLPLILLFAAVLCASEYKFTALGDTHYDGAQYHTSPPAKSYQKRERQRNYSMWSDGRSDAVLAAAAKKTTPEMRFVVQLGDLTQGDCDTSGLFEKMFADAFAKIKSHFPDNKLLIVKGNHDVRQLNVEGKSNGPAAKALLPLIAKELGRKSIAGNYMVMQDKDLHLFLDNYVAPQVTVNFVKECLKDNPDTRYLFLYMHYPLLFSSPSNHPYITGDYKELTPLLAARNVIVFCGHTHMNTFSELTLPQGKITQVVLSSIGCDWYPEQVPTVKWKDFDALCGRIKPKRMKMPAVTEMLSVMKSNPLSYICYNRQAGFAVVNVNDKEVTAEVYVSDSGKPWVVKTLGRNVKTK